VRRPWQTPLIGILALMVWLVTVMFALAITTTPLGAGCLLLAVSLLLLAKLLGIVGVAWLIGRAGLRALPIAWRGELPRTGVALLVMTALSAIPTLGGSLWLVVNVVGIGAVVGTVLERLPIGFPFPRLATR
jgi:hypothetical protein